MADAGQEFWILCAWGVETIPRGLALVKFVLTLQQFRASLKCTNADTNEKTLPVVSRVTSAMPSPDITLD